LKDEEDISNPSSVAIESAFGLYSKRPEFGGSVRKRQGAAALHDASRIS
jgi:hypothetical protein